MIKMKPLLKESTWTNRKFGESLPTLEDYMSETYDDENCGDGHEVVSEADDDKYVSVGWGKYKEKGKEDDENAPSFTKTDSGKFVKSGDDKKGDKGDKPEKEPTGKLGGGDFERPDTSEPEDKPFGGDTGKDPDYDYETGEFTGDDEYALSGDDDPTRGDPDDAWDDEEGRAKPPIGWKPTRPSYTPSGEPNTIGVDPDDPDAPAPKGGDITPVDNDKDIKRMAASIEKKTNSPKGSLELQGGTNADDGTPIIQWKDKTDGMLMGISDDGSVYEDGKKTSYKADQGDDVHQKGMAKAKDLAKKGMKKRPGGKKAEEDYMKADQMMMKYAGVDIEKAEYWAKKKRQASNAMMGEIIINGKKYEPITESIKPTIYDPNKEIKRAWNRISLRQFDRKWKK